MNVKTLAIVGTIAGLGLLGLQTQSANAAGLSLRVAIPAPVFFAPPIPQFVQPVVVQQPQVVYQQAPQVVYQPAPQVIYEQAPQVVVQDACAAPVYYQARPLFAPVIIRPEGRFDHDDFHRDHVDVRFGGGRR